jgi:hypothetical protein
MDAAQLGVTLCSHSPRSGLARTVAVERSAAVERDAFNAADARFSETRIRSQIWSQK